MQYKQEKFLIIKNIKKFILSLDDILINFPKKEFVTKDIFYKEALSILKAIYLANTYDNIEEKNRIKHEVVAQISMLDFYLERAYKKKYISEKQCMTKSRELETITKMIYKWIKNDK